MIELNFPPIQKCVVLDRNNLGSPQNFITIRHGVALIMGLNYMFCFDLRNYFLGNQLVPETDKDSFEAVMNFLEGKRLNPDFWQKFVGKNKLHVVDEETISVSNDKTSFDLHYEELVFFDESKLDAYLSILKSISTSPNQAVYSFSPRPDALNVFLKGFSTMIRSAQLVVKFKSDKNYQVFTVNNMPYIFGLLSSDSEINNRSFHFDNLNQFIVKLNG